MQTALIGSEDRISPELKEKGNLDDQDYEAFIGRVRKRFRENCKRGPLFRTNISGEEIWNWYLSGFERLDTLEELVAKCRTYEEALTIRAELGSRAKQSQLLRELQEASGKGEGPRTITGAEHKQLSAAWGRADRQLAKKEASLAPSVEASFIDDERQPGEDDR